MNFGIDTPFWGKEFHPARAVVESIRHVQGHVARPSPLTAKGSGFGGSQANGLICGDGWTRTELHPAGFRDMMKIDLLVTLGAPRVYATG